MLRSTASNLKQSPLCESKKSRQTCQHAVVLLKHTCNTCQMFRSPVLYELRRLYFKRPQTLSLRARGEGKKSDLQNPKLTKCQDFQSRKLNSELKGTDGAGVLALLGSLMRGEASKPNNSQLQAFRVYSGSFSVYGARVECADCSLHMYIYICIYIYIYIYIPRASKKNRGTPSNSMPKHPKHAWRFTGSYQ